MSENRFSPLHVHELFLSNESNKLLISALQVALSKINALLIKPEALIYIGNQGPIRGKRGGWADPGGMWWLATYPPLNTLLRTRCSLHTQILTFMMLAHTATGAGLADTNSEWRVQLSKRIPFFFFDVFRTRSYDFYYLKCLACNQGL